MLYYKFILYITRGAPNKAVKKKFSCTNTVFSINLDRNFKFDAGPKLLNCSKYAFNFLRVGYSSATLSSLGNNPDDNDKFITLLNIGTRLE